MNAVSAFASSDGHARQRAALRVGDLAAQRRRGLREHGHGAETESESGE